MQMHGQLNGISNDVPAWEISIISVSIIVIARAHYADINVNVIHRFLDNYMKTTIINMDVNANAVEQTKNPTWVSQPLTNLHC